MALTHPLWRVATDAIPGIGQDGWQHYWNLWWVRRALVDLHASPYFTHDLYHPYGASLYFHSFEPAIALLVLPVVATLGLAAAYNVAVLLAFVLGGLGAYLLCREVLGSTAADARRVELSAFLAGCAFTFSAYHFAHLLGHLDAVSLQWIPFYVLYGLRAERTGSRRDVLLAVLFLLLASLTYWYYALYLLAFTALLAIDRRIERGAWRPTLGRLGTVVGLYLAAVSPLLVPMLASGGAGAPYDAVRDNLRFSADLSAFLTPSPLHPVWGRFLEPAYDTLRRNGSHTESIVFLGGLTLVLAVLGSPTRRPQRFWFVAAVVFLLFALGPVLHVDGRTVTVFGRPLALPFGLLLHAPVFGSTRAPARWTVMASLCLSVLAGGGALRLLAGFRNPLWMFLALTGALLFESAAVPFPFARPRALVGYAQLAAEPGRGAVLEIPLHDDPGLVPQRMLFQTVHGKPVFGGYLSRGLPPLRFHAIPGFAQLQTLTPEVEDVVAYSPADLPALSRAALVEMGAGFVVVDRGLLEPDTIAAARATMRQIFGDLPPLYDGADSIVYRLPARVPAAPAFVFLDRGWYALERRPLLSPPDHPPLWRWMGKRADLRLLAPAEGRWRLRLRVWAHDRAHRLSLRAGLAPIGTFAVGASLVTLETPEFTAPAGSSAIEILSLDGADRAGEDPRQLSVAFAEITLLPPRAEPSKPGSSRPEP